MKRRQGGVALLLAVWAMLAMAAITAGVELRARHDVQLADARAEQVRLKAAADGMVWLTLQRLLDPAADPPRLDGTAYTLSVGGITGSVSVQDEAGLVDLNQAQGPLLERLLRIAGADGEQAETLADRLQDWRDPSSARRLHGAQAAEYREAGLAYAPRGGAFRTIDEARLVLGMDAALFARLRPSLTVASQNAVPEAATAPVPVLQALPGMDAARIALVMAARAGAAPVVAANHAYEIAVVIHGRISGLERHALVRLTGIPAVPYRVYAWQ